MSYGNSGSGGNGPAAASVVARPVEYFEHDLMPGKPMFRCERLSSTLQVATCASMWRKADQGDNDKLWQSSGSAHIRSGGKVDASVSACASCLRCPVGAKHAGVADASLSPFRGTGLCSRCSRTDQRLIGGNICVSCYNRQAEVLKGRDARGKTPIKHPPLERRFIRYVIDGQVKMLSRPHTISSDELVIELLRDCSKKVVFGRGCGKSMLRQQGLV